MLAEVLLQKARMRGYAASQFFSTMLNLSAEVARYFLDVECRKSLCLARHFGVLYLEPPCLNLDMSYRKQW